MRDTVNVAAAAADDVAVAGVQFFVDGVTAGPEDRTAPYTVPWDTHLLANGTHVLTARARDATGNTAVSSQVAVSVANTGVFQDETLATQFSLPTSFTFLPDGRMLVGQMGGKVLVVPPPYTQPDVTPLLTITNIPNVSSSSDIEGLMNVAVDPNFATNHYFYVDYTAANPFRTRLSRFTANAAVNGTVAGSELILYQDTADAGIDHHAGAIMFGNDGKLYFTTGDEFSTPGTSQQLTSPRGKIHRINMDGTVPIDNPFFDGSGPNVDSIWALGLRNPFRGYYDAPTGRLFVGDVGGNVDSTATEHLDLGFPGANYAWPDCESTVPRRRLRTGSTAMRTTGATPASSPGSSTTEPSSRARMRAASSSPTTPRTGSSASRSTPTGTSVGSSTSPLSTARPTARTGAASPSDGRP